MAVSVPSQLSAYGEVAAHALGRSVIGCYARTRTHTHTNTHFMHTQRRASGGAPRPASAS